MSNTGLPNNSQVDHFSIQQSDVAQMNEEKRSFEDWLSREGVGLVNCQFIPPSPDNLIGGINFPIQRFYPDLYAEEHKGPINNYEVDRKYCEKLLEYNYYFYIINDC